VAGSCEYGDEPSCSGATDLVSYVEILHFSSSALDQAMFDICNTFLECQRSIVHNSSTIYALF
jgi:hypothetical protein